MNELSNSISSEVFYRDPYSKISEICMSSENTSAECILLSVESQQLPEVHKENQLGQAFEELSKIKESISSLYKTLETVKFDQNSKNASSDKLLLKVQLQENKLINLDELIKQNERRERILEHFIEVIETVNSGFDSLKYRKDLMLNRHERMEKTAKKISVAHSR